LVLALVSTSIVAFFLWQVLASGIHVFTVMVALWSRLPRSAHRPSFKIDELRRIWRFAAGMSLIALTGIVLIQIDKVVLSRQLDLLEFGYYALAAVVGMSLAYVTGPVFNAVFPRFSALVARDEREALTHLYHRATQFLAVILLPAACTLAILAMDIMRLWTGNPTTAQHTQTVVAILAVGSAINGLMSMPYALQLAHGWTSLGVRINILLVVLAVPTAVVLGSVYGGPGAASVWVLTQSIYMLIGVPATHRRLMPGEARRWFLVDVGGPLLASLAVVLIGLRMVDPAESRLLEAIRIAAILLASVGAATMAAPMMREWSAGVARRMGAIAMRKLSNSSAPK
jgi:O-antigen/teichoic acid export membrane protein